MRGKFTPGNHPEFHHHISLYLTPLAGVVDVCVNEIIVEVCVPLYWPTPDIYKFSFISKINIVMSCHRSV